MGDPALADDSKIIDFPYHNMSDHYYFWFGHYEIGANDMLMVDNLMGFTHLGYVHTLAIGGNPGEHDDAEMATNKTPTSAEYTHWLSFA